MPLPLDKPPGKAEDNRLRDRYTIGVALGVDAPKATPPRSLDL